MKLACLVVLVACNTHELAAYDAPTLLVGPPDLPAARATELSIVPASNDATVQLRAFTSGLGPIEYVATAPHNAQLVVWAALYKNGTIDPRYCPHQIHRFARAGSVPITLGFDWAPKPGNTRHAYRIAIAGAATEEWMRSPFFEFHVGAEDVGKGASPARGDTDYILVARLWDGQQAGGFHDIADGIATHDAGLVIYARLFAPRELAIRFDAERCAFN